MKKQVEFLKNAILGKKVGAISRSSKYVIERVIKNLKGSRAAVVIEYGPGDGVLTRELLKIIPQNGKLVAVELDANFIRALKKINDPRLLVVSGTMENVSADITRYGVSKADVIIASIPFSLIHRKDREMVVLNSARSLTAEGKLIIFHQYSKLMEPYIKKYFKKTTSTFEPRNFFPCFIMVGTDPQVDEQEDINSRLLL